MSLQGDKLKSFLRTNQRGQAYTAFKLLQGAMIAIIFIGIVYGILAMVQSYFFESDPFTISSRLLSSAYAAAKQGKPEQFTGEAKLKEEDFSPNSLKNKAGVPKTVNVVLECDLPISDTCKPGVRVSSQNKLIHFEGSYKIGVCAMCSTTKSCNIVYGSGAC